MQRILGLIAIGSAACARPTATAPTSAGPDAVEHARAEANVVWIEEHFTELCACTDLACVQRVASLLAPWVPSHFGEARFDDAQRDRALAAHERLVGCTATIAAHLQADRDGLEAQPLVEMRAIERSMCGCTDVTCAKRVSAEMEEVLDRHAETKATEPQLKEAGAIMGRIVECQARAAGRQP